VIVCLCHNVSDRTVRDWARSGLSLAEVIERTKAGTGCGMCKLDVARIWATATEERATRRSEKAPPEKAPPEKAPREAA
jgi:bacterioferritin-associated ferredoxin